MYKTDIYFAPTAELVSFEANDIVTVSPLVAEAEGVGNNEFTW